MCGSMADIQSAAAEIRRGKKKRRKEDRNHRAKIYWSALLHRATMKTDMLGRNGPGIESVESVLRPEAGL